MTEQVDYAALRRVMGAATKGPWMADAVDEIITKDRAWKIADLSFAGEVYGDAAMTETEIAANAEFIALSRNAMPEMLALLVEARKELDDARVAVHSRHGPIGPWMNDCRHEGCVILRDLIASLPEDV